ncbi:cell division protein ZapE [Arthrobacter sp. ISL-48]|uniref:AFG1/ZapE family ATPase n=1 Tax=Arthrobacter sp. ISL-48 TaxID=2819110 RepID=UPI001BE73EA8|nr:AFG1/ZapE family ATPase [Arthrobacter sp. ISL-48]MBT2532002.1 cell division protein ZapE [Arthrobacter sp. ISL-48]
MDGGNDGAAKPNFVRGRIITPGTEHQLGTFGLFPPSPGQRRTLRPTTLLLTAKNAEPELLWISFAEICDSRVSAAEYEVLARRHKTWVVDDVTTPEVDQPPHQSSAWHRFSTLVDVLYAHDDTLFLVGSGLSAGLARVAGRLSLLELVESADVLVTDPASGS